ncbi:methyltransferase [Gammaproteobacteria bacterium]|nr:methyltransferase [Gammaproteobacteria bacterium]
MKVGTDGVLLGAWFQARNTDRILDIGTGTGLLSLMAAQRFPHAKIEGIDIDENAVKQAKENVLNSPFSKRINIHFSSFQEYSNTPFHSIICNPPYFIQSVKNPNKQRELARHAPSIDFFKLLFQKVDTLLEPKGYFSIIFPTLDWPKIEKYIPSHWSISRLCNVHPTTTSNSKRVLIEFQKTSKHIDTEIHSEKIIIELARHSYTPEYIKLTKDFYIKM